MTKTTPCPCGSEKDFTHCCAPYLRGDAFPPSAEALMRSRYTAYVKHDDAYLLTSWDPQTRPDNPSPSADKGTTWIDLRIVRSEAGGETDNAGVVEFIAAYDVRGVPGQLHETSRFRRNEAGHWVYIDGDTRQPARRSEAKVGRNDPCPCGSGKKFKKCCGK